MPLGIAPPQGFAASSLVNSSSIAKQLGMVLDVKRDFNASGSSQSTTGSITAGSNVLTLASAIDFQNGQGISIANAGPLPSISAPTSATATAEGTTGSTTITYAVAALDGNGGVTAAFQFSVTNANATLSSTNYVALSVTAVTGATGYAWWRVSTNGTAPTSLGLIGITLAESAAGNNGTTINDTGLSIIQPPTGVPSNPPSSAMGDLLTSKILSGGGTTTIVLSTSANSTVSNAVVSHDDTASIQAALNALPPTGGVVYIPSGTYLINNTKLNIPNANFAIVGDGGDLSILLCGPIGYGTAPFSILNENHYLFYGVGFHSTLEVPVVAFAYTFNSAPTPSVVFDSCHFIDYYGANALLQMQGVRESSIRNCLFSSVAPSYSMTQTAIYFLENCINIEVHSSVIYSAQFTLNVGIIVWNNNNNTIGNQGIRIVNSLIIGTIMGIWSVQETNPNDFISVVGSMIDNVNRPLVIYSANNVLLSGSYFGGNGSSIMSMMDFVSVSGLVIDGCIITSYTNQPNGISLDSQVQDVAITNNYISGVSNAINVSGLTVNKLSAIQNNIGFNPVGNVPSPTMPASGVALTNPYPYTCRIAISGGSVSNIAIDGFYTGLTGGMFVLGPGETIILNYSVAPSWTWFGL